MTAFGKQFSDAFIDELKSDSGEEHSDDDELCKPLVDIVEAFSHIHGELHRYDLLKVAITSAESILSEMSAPQDYMLKTVELGKKTTEEIRQDLYKKAEQIKTGLDEILKNRLG